ncbi:MAG TPA: glycosyltransferase family 9 protein [Flavitalea sp.]|nr:glycosyltransferase family 9 protein [Flavitalea sp.]
MSQSGDLKNKRVLCVRPDNMGDLLMSSPAIAALKETFDVDVTVLTSSMAKHIVPFIPVIDNYIIADLPWVKSDAPTESIDKTVLEVRKENFDAAFIFTVFSQNPLPSAMICYQAGIPEIFGYCRENPYKLINHWIPDDEPYSTIRHQVVRDLQLVALAGAYTSDHRLRLRDVDTLTFQQILQQRGIRKGQPYIIIHPGVSELKRQYPGRSWLEVCKRVVDQFQLPLLFTGTEREHTMAQEIIDGVGHGCYNLAGKLNLEEFIAAIKNASLVISVNTSTIHIASAVETPVIVIYAATNPQHTPWMVPNEVMYFEVQEGLRSKNEVLRWVGKQWTDIPAGYPSSSSILSACERLLKPVQHNSIA